MKKIKHDDYVALVKLFQNSSQVKLVSDFLKVHDTQLIVSEGSSPDPSIGPMRSMAIDGFISFDGYLGVERQIIQFINDYPKFNACSHLMKMKNYKTYMELRESCEPVRALYEKYKSYFNRIEKK